MELLIYIAAAFIGGAFLAYVYTKTRHEGILPGLKRDLNNVHQTVNRLEEERKILNAQNDRLLTENGRLTGQLEQTTLRLQERTAELSVLGENVSTAREQLISSARQQQFQQENLERLKTELQVMTGTMRTEFRLVADTILEEKTKKFTDMNE
ncbi:MAG TPA: hypothetical protein VLC28_00640, partial [Flavitalea sp.]|nr:hypothetical protein [Flavitalea sp.]